MATTDKLLGTTNITKYRWLIQMGWEGEKELYISIASFFLNPVKF